MDKNKKEYIKSLNGFIKANPTLYGLNTSDFKDFLIDLVNIESTYRKNVKGRTADGKPSGYNGYYALPISHLASANQQHKAAFKNLSEILNHVLVQEDIAKAAELGISEAQLVGKVWNQRNRAINYIYNGIDTTDGNGIKVSEYGTSNRTPRITSDLNIVNYTKPAITSDYYEVQPGDTFSTIQERVRTAGRNYNRKGLDLLEGYHNSQLDLSRLRPGTPIKTIVDTPTERLLGLDKFSPVTNAPQIPMKKYGGIRSRYGWGGISTKEYFINSNSNYVANSFQFHKNEMNDNISQKLQGTDQYYRFWNSDARRFDYISYDNISLNDAIARSGKYDSAGGDIVYLYSLTDEGLRKLENQKLHDRSISDNMETRIDSDIEQRRQVINTAAKYGAFIPRKKFNMGGFNNIQSPYSGNIGWGMRVTPDNIHKYTSAWKADNEGIYGKNIANYASIGASTGLGLGTMMGSIGATTGAAASAAATGAAAAGAGFGSWLGPIGLLAGAGIGALIGWLTGDNEKDTIEQQRKEQLAQVEEINRQQTISNMQYRHENDVAKIRNYNKGISSFNNSFYKKYGGMIGCRKKLEYGGHIIPNSDDSAVAYGRTHDQVNPITGQTGVTYGNAEVEGGGFINGQELAGEVIRQTPMGDQIFTNSLNIPGTNQTYAEYAKRLTDSKGTLEKDIEMTKVALDKALNMFSQSKLTKSKTGTATRNIEKLASKLNIKTAQLAKLDAELDNLFVTQEQDATNLGLRETTPMVAKFGGYRPKYKFGIPELNLVGSGLGFVANMLASGLKARSNRESLAFMKNLKTPKMNHLETQYHRIDTSPYDDAERKALIENRRLDRWLEDNTNNIQVLRNQKRQNHINYIDQLSSILSGKSAYLTSIYDKNYNARVATNNANRKIDYQNLVTDYNRDLAYLKEMQRVKEGEVNDYMTAINGLVQGLGTYTNQRIMLASYPEAIQNEFYFGKKNKNLQTTTQPKVTTPNQSLTQIPNKSDDLITKLLNNKDTRDRILLMLGLHTIS